MKRNPDNVADDATCKNHKSRRQLLL